MKLPQARGSLEGKRLVVMGATSGIGLASVQGFAAAGAQIVGVGRDRSKIEQAQSALPGELFFLEGDAIVPETGEKAVAECVRRFGGIDGLFHVAGGSGRRHGDGPLDAIPDSGWRSTLEHNLDSVFYSNRAAVRAFLNSGTGGSIVNLGSVLSVSPSPRHFATHAYATAKSALCGLTTACASFYATNRIRFNLLLSGLVATPMSQRAQDDPDIVAFAKRKQPLSEGGFARAEDIAAAAAYFLSDSASAVTGQILAVDAGWSVTEA